MRWISTLIFVLTTYMGFAVSMGQVLGQIVVRETGAPLTNAEIVFENRMDKVTVVANEFGHYFADHLPTGRYQMRVEYNGRTFVMNKVQVYDNNTIELDFAVSNDGALPLLVELEPRPNLMSSVTSVDIALKNSSNHQPTRSLADALSMHPGVDVRNGKLFIKGSDQVKYFVDGTPVLGQATIGRIW